VWRSGLTRLPSKQVPREFESHHLLSSIVPIFKRFAKLSQTVYLLEVIPAGSSPKKLAFSQIPSEADVLSQLASQYRDLVAQEHLERCQEGIIGWGIPQVGRRVDWCISGLEAFSSGSTRLTALQLIENN
jgi:hypothetical protein